MSDETSPQAQPFAEDPQDRGSDEPTLIVDVDGFEGPLDLLLTLARNQKVDLARISILALADQYLAFVEQARQMRLDLAADYLVMAAWLAYLKSRLLLPEPAAAEGQSAADLANALAMRLKRLEAIRGLLQNCSSGLCSAATCSRAATPSRSPRSNAQNGRRRFTTSFRHMRPSASAMCDAGCGWRGAMCGRWSKRAPSLNASSAPPASGRDSTTSSSPMWSSRQCARPHSPLRLPRPLNWCATAAWNFARRALSPPFICAGAVARPRRMPEHRRQK
jgi:hypothetical protein